MRTIRNKYFLHIKEQQSPMYYLMTVGLLALVLISTIEISVKLGYAASGPVITSIDPSMPAPGSTATITGSGFSVKANQNLVTFDRAGNARIQAQVLSASATSLRVIVPQTAVSGKVTVKVGSLTSPDFMVTLATNLPPTVNAGPDQTITLPASANLSGTASDDGLPVGGTLTKTWSKFSGPGTVAFANVNSLTQASFSTSGTYVLRLTATDSVLSSSDDVTIIVNPVLDTTAPSTPTGLSASPISSSQINLNWNPSTDNVGVTGYRIHRDGTQIATTTAVSYQDTNLVSSTTYTYAVAAYDLAGNISAISASVSGTTLPPLPPGTVIDPSRRIDWSNAGVSGGIPTNRPSCTTAECNTLYGGLVTSASINAAIASALPNTVVRIPAGAYNISSGITFRGKSNVTLRGAGTGQTVLQFTGSDGCGGQGGDICVINASGYHVESAEVQPGGSNAASWTSGDAKGATQITLDNVSGLSSGSVIILDQLNDSADTGGVFVCDTVPMCVTEGRGGQGRPGRAQEQFVHVTAINGNQVSITPGLYMPNWRASQSPGAFWTGPQAEYDGIEDMTLDHTRETGLSGVYFFNAHNSWVKNIKSLNAARNHVWFYLSSHIQVQHSYFYGTQNAASQSYAIESYGSADNLVQNNIFQHITNPMLNDNTAGSVYAYNYSTDDYYTINGNPTDWAQPSSYHHAPGNSYILWEGNHGFGLEADNVHGTSDFITAFRNRWHGWETGKAQQTVAVHIYDFNRYYNIIGNVLGESGYHTNYTSSPQDSGPCNLSIYALGWGKNCATSGSTPPLDDILVKTTLMRWGNYDTVDGSSLFVSHEVPSGLSQYGNAVPSDQNLPPSLFLSSKASWWGAMPWPAIGPDVTGGNISGVGGRAYMIPSEVCYNNTPKTNGILNFNADDCYGSGSVTPP